MAARQVGSDHEAPVDPIGVAHAHDVGMLEVRGGARLPLDLGAAVLLDHRGECDLERDFALLDRVAGGPDLRERPASKPPLEAVLAESRSSAQYGRHAARDATRR